MAGRSWQVEIGGQRRTVEAAHNPLTEKVAVSVDGVPVETRASRRALSARSTHSFSISDHSAGVTLEYSLTQPTFRLVVDGQPVEEAQAADAPNTARVRVLAISVCGIVGIAIFLLVLHRC